jgi:RNA polymerase sigma-70 factor (ECF subfamily)
MESPEMGRATARDRLRLVTATGGKIDNDERTALIRAVALGDEASFVRLYDELAPIVFGVVRKVVRDAAQSEEVFQEVMVEVWRTAPRFDATRGSVGSWVTTIAHRRAVDRVRSEQSSRDRLERHAAAEPSGTPGVAEQVVDAIDDQHHRQQVDAALRALTPVQRQSVELAFWGGHTHAEVATLLNIPLGTVKTRIRDGLIRLRDGLGVTP